jgi:EAL domain-containing protein (putative c-di-GMP-specific phosphodiesterase class I)/CheY-like chemotaxis protein
VLIVDDDDDVRAYFARVLARAGFDVVEATNGRDALAAIHAAPPAVVLLDNRMPGIGGLHVLARLRADPSTTTLPVILVTGQGELDQRVGGLQAGANDYVTKPVHPDELVARVQAQLRGRDAWLEAVKRNWHQRAVVIEALSRVDGAASTDEISSVVCDTVYALPTVYSVALIRFMGEDAFVLAARGVPSWRAGEAVPGRLGLTVRRLAAEGPWTEDTVNLARAHKPAPWAFVPLWAHSELVGVLALGSDAAHRGGALDSQALATAVDLAPAVAAALGPALGTAADLKAEITHVIALHAFQPVFQAVVDLTDGSALGYEALTRFDDGVQPEFRFTEAARLGVGMELEIATLESAIAAADNLPAHRFLSLNASPQLVLEHELLATTITRCPRDVVIEMTERDRVDDYDAVTESLAALPGTTLAVDDAGAGYSSLRHILTLHPTFIKLDVTWVRDLERDTARQAIVAGLAHFADLTESRLIAECIETEAEADALHRLGVHLGQGYLFGRPAPISQPA